MFENLCCEETGRYKATTGWKLVHSSDDWRTIHIQITVDAVYV